MNFKRLMVVSSAVMSLGLVACNNSSETKEEISLDDAKKYAKSTSEFEKYDYSSIKVTTTIKELNATGNMASLLGNSLQNYVGISQSETFSYKNSYLNYALSTEALKVFESSATEDLKILNYKIYKIDNKISIESSIEQSMNMNYEGYSFSYKVSLTSTINYNEEGLVSSSTSNSSFTYNDNSSLSQKTETTIEWIK